MTAFFDFIFMKKINISTSASVFNDMSELSDRDLMLMKKAINAKESSYAPYSNFSVGAALLLENDEIILGSNQENAAYPSGMCAERVAIWRAGTQFPGVKIISLAISASSSTRKVDKPVGPCGACRQALLEYEVKQNQPFEIIFMGEVGKIVKIESLSALLPFSFDSSYL